MAKLDPFSAQIVEMVRNMSDEAILELVRNQLGALDEGGSAPSTNSRARSGGSTARKSKRGKKRSGGRKTSAERQKALDTVERAVKASKGMSASQIAKKTRIPQTRVSTLVRELKEAGRIHQGGDRRFARYAGDAKTAQKASETARKTASGPQRRKTKSKSRRRKR